jgi:uncharacterized membrane protein YwaF
MVYLFILASPIMIPVALSDILLILSQIYFIIRQNNHIVFPIFVTLIALIAFIPKIVLVKRKEHLRDKIRNMKSKKIRSILSINFISLIICVILAVFDDDYRLE